MIKTLFKKWFWNSYDNLLLIISINLIILILIATSLSLIKFILIPYSLLCSYLTLFLTLLIVFHIITLTNYFAFEIVNYKPLFIKELLLKNFYHSLFKITLPLTLSSIAIFHLIIGTFLYYYQHPSFLNYLSLFLVFWLLLFFILFFSLIIPLSLYNNLPVWRNLLHTSFIVINNPFLMITLLITNAVTLFVILFPPLWLLSGISSSVILQHSAIKLLMYKYQSLEGREKSNKAVWRELLKREQELINIRSLKEIFLPWKNK